MLRSACLLLHHLQGKPTVPEMDPRRRQNNEPINGGDPYGDRHGCVWHLPGSRLVRANARGTPGSRVPQQRHQRFFPIAIRLTRDLAAEINTKAPEGFTTGASTGAAIGGVLGWLVGIGALAIPGIGPIVAAGPVVAALAGAGAAGATGGLVGGLIGAGIPEIEAKRYAGRIREGAYLISVHCDDSKWAKRAEEILEATGGRDVVKTSESSADYRPLAIVRNAQSVRNGLAPFRALHVARSH